MNPSCASLRVLMLAAGFGVGVFSLFRAMPAGSGDGLPPLALSLVAAPLFALVAPGMVFVLISFFILAGQKLPLPPAGRASWRGRVRTMLAFYGFFSEVVLAFGAGLGVAGLRHGPRLLAFGAVFLCAGAGARFGVRRARRTYAKELAEPGGGGGGV